MLQLDRMCIQSIYNTPKVDIDGPTGSASAAPLSEAMCNALPHNFLAQMEPTL